MALTPQGNPLVQTIWRLDLDQDLAAYSGNYVQVKGASQIGPTVEPTTADSTDFDAPGWASTAITLRNAQVQGTVIRKKYPTNFDPGQEFARTCAENISLVHARWYEQTVNGEAYEALGQIAWQPVAGGPADLITSTLTFYGQGARSAITNPWNVATVPIISGVSPVTTPVAGGGIIQIFGSGFATVVQSAANVKFGVTNVTSFLVINDGLIIAVAPAKTAGAYAVVVTNPTGASTTGGTPLTYV